MKKNIIPIILKIITIVTTILLIIFAIWLIKLGILKDKNLLIEYLKDFDILAPLIFIIIQIIQVIIPVIPGGVSSLVGVLAFGPILGFIYNYIGLVLGSIIAYYLAKIYGIKLVRKLFSKSSVKKYLNYTKSKIFALICFFVIFLPGLPDDLVCYIAGLSKMDSKTFFIILLVGKPLSLLGYSILMALY